MPYEKIGKEVRCIADEIPFEIPDSWEWVRLGEIFQHNTGKALNSSNREGKLLKYITTSNLYWDRFELNTIKEMLFTEAELEKCTVCKGDLLVCEGGDIGRAAIWSYDTSICIQNHIHRLRAYYQIFTKFFYYLFYLYKNTGLIGGKGIGIQGLSSNALHSLLFPLPSLAEQKRIVAKIEELLPHIDEYGKAESKVSKLNAEFPEQLKKSILQWAIQGKLVPQNPDDEPASVLLERIRAEKAKLIKEGKIKKDKNESIIFRRDNSHYEKLNGVERCIDEEIPFEIPDSWEWIRLENICNSISDGDHQPPPQTKQGIPFLVISNVSLGKLSFENTRYVPYEYFSNLQESRKPQCGDILFTVTGSFGIVIKVDTQVNFCFQRHIALLKMTSLCNVDFLCKLLSSSLAYEQCKQKATGTAQKTVGLQTLRKLLIPLPPQNEQQQIIDAIESVFKKLTI